MVSLELIKKYSTFSAYLSDYEGDKSDELLQKIITQMCTPSGMNDNIVGDIIAVRKRASPELRNNFPPVLIESISKVLAEIYLALSLTGGVITEELYNRFGTAILSLKPDYTNTELVNNPQVVKDLIRMDFVSQTPFNLSSISMILDKLEQVKSEAPEFFEEYTKVLWVPYIQLIYRATRRVNIPCNIIERYLKLFPNKILSKSIDRYGQLYRFNAYHKSAIQYALGLPIAGVNFSKEELFELVKKALGNKELWNARIKKYNQQYLKEYIRRLSLFGKKNITITNTQNTLLDEIDEYHPEDIFYLVETNNKLFRFTHNEFDSIAESGKNPYTMVDFQQSTFATMKNHTMSRQCVIESARVIEMLEATMEPTTTFDEYLEIEQAERAEYDARQAELTAQLMAQMENDHVVVHLLP